MYNVRLSVHVRASTWTCVCEFFKQKWLQNQGRKQRQRNIDGER